MLHFNETIIVEGKYDKIRLKNFVSSFITETNGFAIFRDKEQQKFIKDLANRNGVIILTDSDDAGFKIRSFIMSILKKGTYTNVYIPDIYGKEKRKDYPSREGKIGVEGINDQIIRASFEKSGLLGEQKNITTTKKNIEKIDLYKYGFYGREGSAKLRRDFLEYLSLPKRLSPKNLLELLNIMFSFEDFAINVETFFKKYN